MAKKKMTKKTMKKTRGGSVVITNPQGEKGSEAQPLTILTSSGVSITLFIGNPPKHAQ